MFVEQRQKRRQRLTTTAAALALVEDSSPVSSSSLLSSSLLFSFPLVIRYVWGLVMHCSAGDDHANRSVSAAHAVSATLSWCTYTFICDDVVPLVL